MKGLELSERFYTEYGLPMLEREFSHLLPYLAIGLCGSGSECFGFDDDISTDHDFEAGFCLFLPDEDIVSRRDAFLLERAYSKLPKSYMGVQRALLSPVGGNRHGVIRIPDFFEEKVGSPTGELSVREWLTLPDQALIEATNGKVFRDDYGLFSKIRKKLLNMPLDLSKKKLAGHLLLCAQAGQYNYPRCLKHNETGAAQLAAIEFVGHAMQSVFTLSNEYMPYYKWRFRALRELPEFSALAETFEFLITTDNDPLTAGTKAAVIEDVCSLLIRSLREKGLSEEISPDLEKHAYAVNDAIDDPTVRNLHILCAT